MTRAELNRRLAWRTPRLEFTDTSIAEAVQLLNRTNRIQLRTGDEKVAALLVTGLFRADNAEGFINVLESSFGVRAERNGDEVTLHTARPPN